MGGSPNGGTGRFARLTQLIRDHPLLAVASALGSLGTFAAGSAAVAGLLGAGEPPVAIGATIKPDELGLPQALSYSFETATDELSQITVRVPIGWTDALDGDGWHVRGLDPIPNGTRIGPGLNATPNVGDWKSDLRTPGVFIGASRDLLETHTPSDILNAIVFDESCVRWAHDTYTKGAYEGEVLTWNCSTAQWRLLAAEHTGSPRYVVYVQVKLVTTADVEAYNEVLRSFEVDFAE
jgi:hypothetical protein